MNNLFLICPCKARTSVGLSTSTVFSITFFLKSLIIENSLSLLALLSAPNSHFLGILHSSCGRSNTNQNFLVLCFEWLIAVRHDIKPFRPGTGSCDPLDWLPPAAHRLYQKMAQRKQRWNG